MTGKLLLFLGLVALARSAVTTVPLAKLEEFDAVPQYSFAYDVQDVITGDSKAQYETRNGDIVQGSYSLIEADGTRRIVEYTADPINGFNAVVSKEPVTAAVSTVAAIATPLIPFRPSLRPVAGAAPAAPLPSIPAVGPDSDVEVVEARSGPLIATRELQRQQQQQQQSQRLQQQEQQIQQLRQLQQLQEQQTQSSRLQIQQQQQQLLQQRQRQRQQQQQQQQLQVRAEEQQLEQQQIQQQAVAISPRIVGQVQPVARAQLVGLPAAAAAKTVVTYPSYRYTVYNPAYSSRITYTAPLSELAYAPVSALA